MIGTKTHAFKTNVPTMGTVTATGTTYINTKCSNSQRLNNDLTQRLQFATKNDWWDKLQVLSVWKILRNNEKLTYVIEPFYGNNLDKFMSILKEVYGILHSRRSQIVGH